MPRTDKGDAAGGSVEESCGLTKKREGRVHLDLDFHLGEKGGRGEDGQRVFKPC